MSDENHVMLSVDELTCVLTLVLKRVRCHRTVTSSPLLIIWQSLIILHVVKLLLMFSCHTIVSRFPATYLFNYHWICYTFQHVMYFSIRNVVFACWNCLTHSVSCCLTRSRYKLLLMFYWNLYDFVIYVSRWRCMVKLLELTCHLLLINWIKYQLPQ